MTFNPFSALTSKIFGGVAIALLVWCAFTTIDRNQWRAAAKKADATLALVKPAQDLALAKAKQAIVDTEARYKELANAADQDHAAAVADARTDADAYAAAHRVPACPAGATRSATTRAESGSSSFSPDLSASSIVGDADLRACSGAAAYALAAHQWASGLGSVNSGDVSQ